jgi:WD40 repeat protein
MTAPTCLFAPRWLQSPAYLSPIDLLNHVENCQQCMHFYDDNASAFEKIMPSGFLLPSTSLLYEANQRINSPGPARFPAEEKDFLTPCAQGYVLIEPLRRSRNSQVFKALQMRPQRKVVLKFIHCSNAHFDYQLLTREGNTLAALKHPNIVTIYQTGKWIEGIWLALEYCPEGSMAKMLANGATWDDRAIANMVRKIAEAVCAAHNDGILHNDIKPGNILFDVDNEPKLADFGLARRLKQDASNKSGLPIHGTPAYMAPEQLHGGLPDVRTDIHGIGGILYHLLTGKPPFSAENEYQSLLQVAHMTPTPAIQLNRKTSPDLNAITMKCLAKLPAERYQSADNLSEDLHAFLSGKPISARKLTAVESLLLWTRTYKTVALSLLSLFVILFSSSCTLLWMASVVNADRNRAIKSEKNTLKLKDLSDLQAYAAKIQAAYFQLQSGTTQSATENLASLPFSKRSWEHDMLYTKLMQNHVTLLGHGAPVRSLTVDPASSEIASVSKDGTARLWDLKQGDFLRTIQGVKPSCYSAVYSPDKSKLALLQGDAKIVIYDLAKRLLLHEINLNMEPLKVSDRLPNSVVFSADSSRVFSGNMRNRLACWDAVSGEMVREFDPFHQARITAVRIAPNGKHLYSASFDGEIVAWDMETGKKIALIPGSGSPVLTFAISPDGNTVVSGGQANTVFVHNAKTGSLLHSLQGHLDGINSIEFDPSGKFVATASDDHTIRLWDVEIGQMYSVLKGHNDFVNCLAFSPDGRVLVSGSSDNTIKIWNWKKLQGNLELNHSSAVTAMTFNRKTGSLVWGDDEGSIGIWNLANDPKRSPTVLISENHAIKSILVNPLNGCISALSCDGIVRVWGPNFTIAPKAIAVSQPVGSITQSPDGAILYLGGTDGILVAWDTKTNSEVYRRDCNKTPIEMVAASLNGLVVAAGCRDGSILLWQAVDGKFIQMFREPHFPITTLALSPDGKWLAFAASGKDIFLVNLVTGKLEHRLIGHSLAVTSLVFNPEGNRLVSASYDHSIKIWDLVFGYEILTLLDHKSDVACIAMPDDGHLLASGGNDGRIIVNSSEFKMDFYKLNKVKFLNELKIRTEKKIDSISQMDFPILSFLEPSNIDWSIGGDSNEQILTYGPISLKNSIEMKKLLAKWTGFVPPN